jgi:hypothetical protein
MNGKGQVKAFEKHYYRSLDRIFNYKYQNDALYVSRNDKDD